MMASDAIGVVWVVIPWVISAISTTVAVLGFLKNRREGRRAQVWAESMKVGQRSYRLRIKNHGKAIAQNVRAEFPDGRGPVIESEIEDKLPTDLPPDGCVDLITGSPAGERFVSIILRWEDLTSKRNVSKQRIAMF